MDVDKRINELGDGSGTLDYDSVIQLASEVLDAAVAAINNIHADDLHEEAAFKMCASVVERAIKLPGDAT